MDGDTFSSLFGSSTYSISDASTLAFFSLPVLDMEGDRLRLGAFFAAACLANMAWMPSLRSASGSMNVGDSVPILPTSLGTA